MWIVSQPAGRCSSSGGGAVISWSLRRFVGLSELRPVCQQKYFGQFHPGSNRRMRSNFLEQSSADRCGSLSVFQNYERLAGFLCFNHSVHCRPICLLGKKLGQFFSVYQPYDKVRFPWKVVSWYSQQLGLSRQNFWSVGWLQISWDSWCLRAVALFQKQLSAWKYS